MSGVNISEPPATHGACTRITAIIPSQVTIPGFSLASAKIFVTFSGVSVTNPIEDITLSDSEIRIGNQLSEKNGILAEVSEAAESLGFAAVMQTASLNEESSAKNPAIAHASSELPSDDAWAAAALAGDEIAFAQLFERHKRLAAHIAFRFFNRYSEVEEIVQESFAEAFCSLGSFQGGHAKAFAAWLARITIHTCYRELRRKGRRSETAMSDLSEDEADYLARRLSDNRPDNQIEQTLISRDLAFKLLDLLGPEDRLALTLLHLEELSIAEAAKVTGWSVSKVKMRAHRARAALQKALKRF